ncbi:MAG: TIM-barrel domain-containing protein [Bacteroidota bacterium]
MTRIRFRSIRSLVLTVPLLASVFRLEAAEIEAFANYSDHHSEGRSIVFTSSTGQRLRVTPYGDYIVRVQWVRKDEDFFSDDRYEMVESHDWDGSLRLSEHESFFLLQTHADNGVVLNISKNPMRISFSSPGWNKPVLRENEGVHWEENSIHATFACDTEEHFTGLGHGYFGRSDRLDLKGQTLQRNYGTEHGQQAPLIVPFYLSSNGYGIFLNSTFPNSFNFGKDGIYEFSIAGNGRMDYFFILGPDFAGILDRYTQLTGRPRLPPIAMFGLGLSDKGNDENSSDPSDERWWKRKVIEHRAAGFPIDHLINDNRWRAGGGKRCESYFEWDTTRFPDPREYEQWVKANGLVVTIDFNRCIAKASERWNPSFNIPVSDSIDFGDSAPDFTRKEVREWFWNLHWRKALSPKLKYPGDALWIDEFDELGKAPASMTLGNGRTWMEMKNYWFFLIAKALVQEGWDEKIGPAKRPFVWVRGMTAGAQRYATLWSGDIKPTYDDMRSQIRSMQLAGLSGFPFWGHDAGGFYDWENKKGPDDVMYRKWSMAFGSFSPFWKPHGMGQSRWPLDRPADVQKDAKTYSELRYKLMPYTYSYAHEASRTGMPIARAMVFEHQHDSLAWKYDLQYMWGREFLVAPNCFDDSSVALWLPTGTWYDFWDDSLWTGNRQITYASPVGVLPLFVRTGSIIPMAPFALSTAFIQKDQLCVHVYVGRDGDFTLTEDDGITEMYRTRGELRTTKFVFIQSIMSLSIGAGSGMYEHAPAYRAYRVVFHGLSHPICFNVNGRQLNFVKSEQEAVASGEGLLWDKEKRCLSVFIKKTPIDRTLLVQGVKDCPGDGAE